MKHRDGRTLPSLVYVTLVCNTVSSLYLKNCIYGCSICLCHHGMARPQVADGGMASYMEGSCE